MPDSHTDEEILVPDRRRDERRRHPRLAELSLPEARRVVVTSVLFAIVLGLFLWMVRTVIIAAILGIVIAVYLRPACAWLARRVPDALAALVTLVGTIVPVIAATVYGYLEVRGAARYVAGNEDEIARRVAAAVRRLPFLEAVDSYEQVRGAVSRAAVYATEIPGELNQAIGELSIATAVFLFTAFYVLTSGPEIARWIRKKVPPRYAELVGALEENVRGVLYGAVYATLITQSIKSGVILGLNLLFGVPLAVVLAMLSFVIGFFPIVGSWSVYVPVAIWLAVFRDATLPALVMLAVGFLVNTLFISMYLRPKLAAEKSQVLNFYWMFLGLVTGVYTFGLAGLLLGPILIGLLKAILDTVTGGAERWTLVEE